MISLANTILRDNPFSWIKDGDGKSGFSALDGLLKEIKGLISSGYEMIMIVAVFCVAVSMIGAFIMIAAGGQRGRQEGKTSFYHAIWALIIILGIIGILGIICAAAGEVF